MKRKRQTYQDVENRLWNVFADEQSIPTALHAHELIDEIRPRMVCGDCRGVYVAHLVWAPAPNVEPWQLQRSTWTWVPKCRHADGCRWKPDGDA